MSRPGKARAAITRASKQEAIRQGQCVYDGISRGGRARPVRKRRNRPPFQRTRNGWNWDSHWITSQHLYTNCTTMQSSSQTPTHYKSRYNWCLLQRRSEGAPGQSWRPTIQSGKGRPDCTTDHPEDRHPGSTRSWPVGRYQRRDQGFRSSDITMDQEVKGQSAKPQMESNKISARALGKFHRRGEMPGILRWDEVDNEIQQEAINISTELAIRNKKQNEDQDVRDTVPQEYYHMLDVFKKGEKTTVPLHRAGINLGIDQEEGKMVPIKKIHALSYDQLEELYRYIKPDDGFEVWSQEGLHQLCLSR